MDSGLGIIIGGMHTYRDMGLKWIGAEIGAPEPTTSFTQIPGSSHYVDLLKAIRADSEPVLSRRTLEFTFDCFGDMEEWGTKYSFLLNNINGKEATIVLDTDPQFYYKGIVMVNSSKDNYAVCDYTISVDAEPYKYSVITSTADWQWDNFSFQNGIILELKDIQITGQKSVLVPGNREVAVIPIINVTKLTGSMSVSYNGRTFSLKLGENRFPQIRVGRDDVSLIFTGTGTVNIEYRRRSQ